MDFVFTDLGNSPVLPVPELVTEVYVPVVSGGLDFKSEGNFEFIDGLLKNYGKLCSSDFNGVLHIQFKLVDDDEGIFVEGKSPLFNEKSDFDIIFVRFHNDEELDSVGEFNGDFVDLKFV